MRPQFFLLCLVICCLGTLAHAAAPTITSFSPASGPIGTVVTVIGTNLATLPTATVNGKTGTVNVTAITLTIAAGTTTGKISITTPGGTATSADIFTVIPAPTITSHTQSGRIGATVTVIGTNLTGTSAVKFNGKASTAITNITATSLKATVPAGATSGKITVTTPGGTATSATNFTVIPAPTITSFTQSGRVGATVTVIGTNLTGASAVKFNGVTSTAITNITATALKATVPAGATTGKITVTTPGGTATSATNFTVIPAPTVTSFTPTSGGVGATVTMTGTNLTGANAVKFNGTSSTSVTNITSTSLKATVPTGATSGKISVTTPGGTSTSAAYFTVIPAPTISNFTPASGVVGTTVTLTGSNFTGASTVKINATAATSYSVVSDTSIIVTVPTGATTGKISITTPGGTATSAANFTIIPAPTISSFTPTSGVVDMSVTLTGSNFTGASAVKFNATAATSYSVVSATCIKVAVPKGATTGKISVITPEGTAISATKFTVIPAPGISSFTPASGGVGTTVTLIGSNFTGASAVKINTTAATSFSVVSATNIKFGVPIGATTGKISVITPGGTATSATKFTVVPAPTITSFTPTNCPISSVVTIAGTNFTGTTAVSFNGTAATNFAVASATSISATVPSGATTGKITVTTFGGSVSSAANITVTAGTPGTPGSNTTDGASMVWVPGGTFTMGTPYDAWWNEPYTQQVTLDGFWIYKYEVTVALYRVFCSATSRGLPSFPSYYSWAGKSGWADPSLQQHPIVNVTWADAKAYADWAGVRLPTEAQWEYSARGVEGRNYPWGGTATADDEYNGWDMTKCANYDNSYAVGKSTWPVDTFIPDASWCKAQDMAGNVIEWCADWYGDYSSTPVINPTGPTSGNIRVLRGSSWGLFREQSRSSYRYNFNPTDGWSYCGFRCVSLSPGP